MTIHRLRHGEFMYKFDAPETASIQNLSDTRKGLEVTSEPLPRTAKGNVLLPVRHATSASMTLPVGRAKRGGECLLERDDWSHVRDQ